ncbi:phage portal protein [Lapidilactobacillus mulanensis]|uniref:Phage portal protein n=2 Tax=Lapidilactobacillus mulanensis TaxID=2485999 RepID=A0ABW4DRP0_9LACO|nr:phage portal protein [Lapidilactobacillus mulanensis]
MVASLTNITDHPKISVVQEDYDRIQRDLNIYENRFKPVEYRGVTGKDWNREYVALNMKQVAARRMASIVFNEKAKIEVADKTAKEFVNGVLSANDFEKNLEKYLESMFALGGLAIKPYYDSTAKTIKLSWAQAPTIYPLRSNSNNISDIAIATRITKSEGKKQVYYTLLEFHEWRDSKNYTITNELYRSEINSMVGIKVPLATLYPDLQEQSVLKGFSKSMVTYIKPAGFNNLDITSPLGLAIDSNARSTAKQINDTYDQFHLEIAFGQRRIAVPDSMLQTLTDERNGTIKEVFDPKDPVFKQIPGMNMDDFGIKDLTSDIRADAYIKSINHFIKTYEFQTGFSPGTFSFDKDGLKTATEIVSENSMTYQTRNSQVSQVERGIREVIVSICELASAVGLYHGKIPAMDEITVDFDDGVFVDKNAQADYLIKLFQAGLTPKYRVLMRINGLDEKSAKAMVAEIDDETINSTPTTQEEPPAVDPTKE